MNETHVGSKTQERASEANASKTTYEGHYGDDRKTEGTENGEKRPEAVRVCSHDGESLVE